MFLKLPFSVSLSALFITIQYAVFRKSLRTSFVSLCIYIYIEREGELTVEEASLQTTRYIHINLHNIYIYTSYMCMHYIYIYKYVR